ncbi:MAG: nuclear transport factor 2 family protein [Bacteroidetes bacterium]|nr:nuclear transport factor 2 family protein [Bacteroidota bacterium]
MKVEKNMLISLLLVMLFAYSCNNLTPTVEINKSAEIGLIEKAIHGAIGWAKDKDFELLYGIIANDSNYLEVGPGVRITLGFNEFKKAETFWGSPDFKAISYEIRDLKISVSQSGTVAWYYCVLDDVNEWKGQPASWMNARWTGVLEKRDGRWVIVQMHFSFAQK